MFALLGLPIDAAYHLVSALAGVFTPLLGGLAVAAAIVAFTILVRLLVLPLSYYAFRGQRAQARIAPQVQELYKRHSKQPERLQRELSALYAAEGAGMFTGFLPALLQIPFFTVVYRLFLSGTVGGRPNLLLRQRLFGASLGGHWLTGAGPLSGQGLVFAGLFALLILVAWFSTRAARRWAAPAPAQQRGAAGFLLRVLPFATVAFAALVPLAAGLYLLTTTAWAAAERAVFHRLAPARPAPATSKAQRSPQRSAGRAGPDV
jgi:YidC/Oxa1 family membrane protein insertase